MRQALRDWRPQVHQSHLRQPAFERGELRRAERLRERHVASVDEPLAWSNSAQSREVGSSAALQANCGLSDANASLYGILITLWEDQENGPWHSTLAARLAPIAAIAVGSDSTTDRIASDCAAEFSLTADTASVRDCFR